MILTSFILILLAGNFSGVAESIIFHDSYAKYGWFWSLESWTDHKFFGLFVVNAFHIFKFLMVFSFIGAVMCALYSGYTFNSWQYVIAQILGYISLFAVGFNISFK